MVLVALHTVKTGKKIYKEGETLPKLKKEDEEYLLKVGAAKQIDKASAVVVKYDAEALFENTYDFNTLTVAELKAVCEYIEIPTTGNKADLVATIDAASEVVPDDATVVPD